MNLQDVEQLGRRGLVKSIDMHFARFMARLAGTEKPELILAAMLVSWATSRGHVCCDIKALAGRDLLAPDTGERLLVCPEPEAWQASLRNVIVVGAPGDFRPLILDDSGRLYLFRYWQYENDLAMFIRKACSEKVDGVDGLSLQDGLKRYFPENGSEEPDWQKIATATAVTRRFCVISGGPGTGKTTTVAKILELLHELTTGKRLRIALAAPTGKAAARMEEAIASARKELDCLGCSRACIPLEASTLHRLLGSLPDSPYFRHDAKNPLPVDVVIIDEASMVDLPLMAKLVRALPSEARLILLGDKDQLASVEAGAVLGDICNTGSGDALLECPGDRGVLTSGNVVNRTDREGKVPDAMSCIVELRKSYRFGDESGIGAVSRAVKEGAGDETLALLRDPARKDVSWTEVPQPENLSGVLCEVVLRGFRGYIQASSFHEMLAMFGRFRILCALRRGPYGAVALNRLVESVLVGEGLILPGQWYHGRPIMITTNDYNLKLFNGDIGMILREDWVGVASTSEDAGRGSHNGMSAFFPAASGTPRRFPPARLPAHETAYAMTVHKSQGSEFDEVLLLLSDRESPLHTRELLYTGLTRARAFVGVWGKEAVLRSAVANRIHRSSGLRDAIWAF